MTMNEMAKLVNEVREKYPKGTRIVIEETINDVLLPRKAGLRGTVLNVDDGCQIYVKFDDGKNFRIVYGEDAFRALTPGEIQDELDSVSVEIYHKMQASYDNYLNDLTKEKPEDIVASAYEVVYKQDLIFIFEDNDHYMTLEQMRYLNNKDDPLGFLYDKWVKFDDNHMPMLRDFVYNSIQWEMDQKDKSHLLTHDK